MSRVLQKLGLVRLSAEQREAQLWRIMLVETNIMLPIKLVAMVAATYFYENVLRGGTAVMPNPEATHAYIAQLNSYAAGNFIFWMLLLAARFGKSWPGVLRFSAFALAVLDNLFLSGLIYFTGGLESPLYWLFLGLMIRSAVNFPVFWQQAILNAGACLFYTLALILGEEGWDFFAEEVYWLRLAVLVLLGACCWGVYMLIQRERLRSQAQQEFQLREQSAAATGRLAAEMAHQLKNPLGIINNAAYLLQQQAAPRRPAETESVQVIRDEVARCDKILTHLMDYARLSEGRVEAVDLNAALERALHQVTRAVPVERVTVHKDLATNLPSLFAQRASIEECFLNLIQNAVDAMPGGGTVTLRTRYAGDGKVRIEISDTGAGIPQDKIGKIFEAFYTTKPEGTGLGLAIVKNVIETYNGTITAHATNGDGARFEIVLPVRATPLR